MYRNGKNTHYINEVIRLNFIDKAHKDFYEKKLMEYGNPNTGDVYYKALVYTLRNLRNNKRPFQRNI